MQNQPVMIAIAILLCAMVVMFVSVFLSTRKRKKQANKVKYDVLKYYHNDFKIISACIDESETYYETQSIVDEIHKFTYHYRKVQVHTLLINDTNELLTLWRKKKLVFEKAIYNLN